MTSVPSGRTLASTGISYWYFFSHSAFVVISRTWKGFQQINLNQQHYPKTITNWMNRQKEGCGELVPGDRPSGESVARRVRKQWWASLWGRRRGSNQASSKAPASVAPPLRHRTWTRKSANAAAWGAPRAWRGGVWVLRLPLLYPSQSQILNPTSWSTL
jgi:hypothetical protein